MSGVAQKSQSAITLKGSADIVCDYLSNFLFILKCEVISCFADFGINSILFQRGLYPPENFQSVENYGLTILMSTDNKIKEFLQTTLAQLKGKTGVWSFLILGVFF